MKTRYCFLLVFLAFFLFPAAQAQVSPELYSGMRWRMIGPFRAGRATAVAGVPGDPSTYYFGTAGGGVWKTTDGGAVWKPIFDRAGVASIGALALAPSNPKILYVGTGENSVYSDISHGNGVYRSTDGGATWQHLGLADSRHIGRILVDPRNPDVVLVAAMGHSFGPSVERGVFRSTDGGRTWKKVLYKDESTGAVEMCFEPGNPRVVYATLWHAIRKPGQRGTTSGPGSGLYKSTDEGVSWKQVSGHGLPAGDWGRSGVAVAAGGRRVYLILEAKKDSGLYRSDDAGATWQRITQDERIRGVWFFSEIATDPRNPEVVYVPETSLYRSTDGGRTFTSIKGAPGGDDYHAVWVDPENPRRIFLGVDQGATFSLDGGESWSTWYNQPTAQFYHVATDHRWPYWVYGPQQDSGTMAVASRGDYGQITERDTYPVGGGESGYTIPDPADPDIVWNAGPGGSLVRFSRRTGQVQDVSPAPVALGSQYRFNWSMPLAFSPQDPHVLYLGTQFLLKTADNGMSWQTISPDLTRSAESPAEEKKDKEEPKKTEEERRKIKGTLTTVAPSPVREGVIWTGSNDGYVQVTEDGGATWQNVTPPQVSAWSSIQQIEASHFQAGTAYVAVSRNDLDDLRPYIYRTRDYGKAWQMVAEGIGAADYAHSVREDPVKPGLLYAATEGGVYVSFDDGGHWQSLTLNLPPVRVSDLAVEQDDLVAATYGRSFWILDDITPLRQMEAGAAEARLFAPRPAVRVRRDENQDTPLPPEIPAGQNPPDGAILNYYLPAAPADEITVGIYDGEGKLVREFTSAAPAPESGPPPYVPTYWLARPQPLAKTPGMHRFAWDLRYADPQAIQQQSPYNYPIAAILGATPPAPQGPLALPGKYEVRLRVGGQSYRQPLEVRMDTRVTWSRDVLERQLRLELNLSEALGRNFAAYQQVKELRARLAELAKRPKGDPLATAADALDKKAAALEGEAMEILATPAHSNLMVLNDALTSLIEAVDGADLAPTAAQEASFQKTCQELNQSLVQWQEITEKDAPALGALLAAQKLAGLPEFPAVTAQACGK